MQLEFAQQKTGGLSYSVAKTVYNVLVNIKTIYKGNSVLFISKYIRVEI